VWTLVYYSDYISQPTVFLRRRALDEVGYLDESLHHWGMDWDLFIRLGKRGRIAYIPELLASQREYDDTKTASGERRLCAVSRARPHHASAWPAEISARLLRLWHRHCINVVRRRSAFLLPVVS
jgi:GT2 family glycosyltransferase